MKKQAPVRKRIDLSKVERLDLVFSAHGRYTLERPEIDRLIEGIVQDGHEPTISRILQAERITIADNLAGALDAEDVRLRGRVKAKVEVE